MKNNRRVIAIGALCLGLVSMQNAGAAVLYWNDFNLGTSAVPGGITLAGLTGVEAAGQADFNAKLAAGGWDAVIFGEQNGDAFSSSAAALSSWVAGGGKLIGTTWLDAGLSSLLEGVFVSTNGDTITTDANPVFTGLGATISISNPGWGIFSRGWTPSGTASCLGSLNSGGCAVILGNDGNTYLNSPLNDAYLSLADGERLIANELIQLTTGTQKVSEPVSMSLVGLGLAALGFGRRKKA